MITGIAIQNYRIFDDAFIEPVAGMNVIVGDNEAGKSTLLEAIGLALTGRINGRAAAEELNPFWFNAASVREFFAKYGTSEQVSAPEIFIEIYLDDKDSDSQRHRGVYNSRHRLGEKNTDCPGFKLVVKPDLDYVVEFEDYMKEVETSILPTEFYRVEWLDFDDKPVRRRPKSLQVSFIDSRTLRSSSGVDYHTKSMLSGLLEKKERSQVAIEHRKSRYVMTEGALKAVNERIAEQGQEIHDKSISLGMDQSSRSSWENDVIPHVAEIPFGMAGQGQQAAIKVALAMQRGAASAQFVLIEEPETHLSYSALQKLIQRISSLAGASQQVFATTHSSFVLNRLGINNIQLLANAQSARLSALSDDTVAYFRKLSGYDTLRLVLGSRMILVEGPSDEMIVQRAFRDILGKLPSDLGVDVISMNGITFARAFELAALIDREVIALQDNDGNDPAIVKEPLKKYLSGKRKMFVGDPDLGPTLEPQLIKANGIESLRTILQLRAQDNPETWMPNHKTETALRILESEDSIVFPPYIKEAVEYFRDE